MDILGIVDIPLYVIFLVIILVTGYIYYTWNFNVLKDAGIRHPRAIPVLGTMYTTMKHGFRYVDRAMMGEYGKVFGAYDGRMPTIVVADPEVLKEITVKEFSSFTNRMVFPMRHPVLKHNLLDIFDDHWKLVRSYLTPTFTSGKMRNMSPMVKHAADQFVESIQEHYDEGKEVNVKEISGNFTMEVIASTGFGIQLNTQKDKNHPFIYYAKMAFDFSITNAVMLIIFYLPFLAPILERLGVTIDKKPPVNFFSKVVAEALTERKASDRKHADFLKLMVDAEKEYKKIEESANGHSDNSSSKLKRGLTTDEITAQAMLFLLAGYETTATTLSFIIYHMAVYPEYQENVYQEIKDNFGENEDPSYDNIGNLTYMDQFIDETMRLYPAVARMNRVASRDIEIKGYKFPKDIIVWLSFEALHRNPEVWPEPDKFDPDRFSPEAKAVRDPYNFMPFGMGPRNCVGMRLAQMELKIVLVQVLRRFKFVKTVNTQFPLKMDKQNFMAKTEKDQFVGLEVRK